MYNDYFVSEVLWEYVENFAHAKRSSIESAAGLEDLRSLGKVFVMLVTCE